jgi:hypothetical protein
MIDEPLTDEERARLLERLRRVNEVLIEAGLPADEDTAVTLLTIGVAGMRMAGYPDPEILDCMRNLLSMEMPSVGVVHAKA